MPYIKKDELELLIWIENSMMDILTNRPDLFGKPDDYLENYLKYYDKYLALWNLIEKLQKQFEEARITNKQRMKEYRSNPQTKEIAKEKARVYMKKYYAEVIKNKRFEDREKLREYNRIKQRESRQRRKKKEV